MIFCRIKVLLFLSYIYISDITNLVYFIEDDYDQISEEEQQQLFFV